MPIQSAEELLVHELHDIEDAEKQASKALQQMMKEVEEEGLRVMLERRMQEGQRVLEAVQSGLERLNGQSRGTRNEAARGLIEEAQKLLQEVQTPEMKQAVMIAGTQKLEHYCIAAWGTVKSIARDLGEEELVEAMQEALDEGYAWDREMTELAEGAINPEAMMSEMEEDEEEGGGRSQSGGRGGQGGQGGRGQSGGRKTQSAKGGSKSEGQQGGGRKSQSARSSSGGSKSSGGSQQGGKSQKAKSGSGQGGGSSDLKSREYRDKEGNVHHHTRSYMKREGQ